MVREGSGFSVLGLCCLDFKDSVFCAKGGFTSRLHYHFPDEVEGEEPKTWVYKDDNSGTVYVTGKPRFIDLLVVRLQRLINGE